MPGRPEPVEGRTAHISRGSTGLITALETFATGAPDWPPPRFLLCNAAMEPVIPRLKRLRLFAQLSEEALKDLIAVPGVEAGAAGEVVFTEPGDLVVLLE